MTILTGLLLLVGAIGWLKVWQQRQQSKLLLTQLERQLDQVLNGQRVDSHFDEAYHSLIEEKLNRFLTTSQKKASDELLIKEQVQALVSNIAHQSKTPLTNMLLYSQLLAEQLHDRSQLDLLSQIDEQSTKLAFFLESLIKTSYLETELVQVKPKPNDLHLLVLQSIASLQQKAQAKEIAIQYQEQSLFAQFDEKWTLEALVNVLDNSIKYSPNKSTITIALNAYECFSCVTVSDQGPGIPESEHAQIFERFYRSPTVSQHAGLGIGLYLTRTILTAQGGYITVSAPRQQGAQFALFLSRQTI